MTARTAHDLDALSFADRVLLPVPTMISPGLDVERHTPLTIPSRCDQRPSTSPLGLADKLLNDSPAEADGRVAKIGAYLRNAVRAFQENSPEKSSTCQACGACCSFSRHWPRFTTEDDSDLDRIPRAFADHHLGRMQCNGDRCAALVGEVGISTSCAVYNVRPDVCRACQPGDEACQLARHRFGLSPLH